MEYDKDIFKDVKQSCIDLSQIAFLPPEVANTLLSSKNLTNALQKLHEKLSSSVQKYCQLHNTDRLSLNGKLGDYIFVPISYLLKQHLTFTDRQVELLFKLINILITHCWYFPVNSSPTLFSQLFPLFIYLIDAKTSKISLSTESKIAGINSLHSLLECLVIQKSNFFEDPKSLPLLGQLITLALDFSLIQNAIVLQSKSLQLLYLLYTGVIHDGEVLSHILPGNVSKLTKLIAQKEGMTTHYSILKLVLDLLSYLFCTVFNDHDLGTINVKGEIKDIDDLVEFANKVNVKDDTKGSEYEIAIPESSTQLHRTNSWLKATSHQVKLAVSVIISLKDHKKFETRKALFSFCELIINTSSNSLFECLPLLVDCVSFLSNDEQLSKEISQWIANEPALAGVIASKLESRIATLPNTLSSSNQEKIVSELNSLSFYLCHSFDHNPFTMKDFAETLNKSMLGYIGAEITTKRFQNKNMQLLLNPESLSSDLIIVQNSYKSTVEARDDFKLFDKFYDPEVEQAISNMLQLLGQSPKWFVQVSNSLLNSGEEELLPKALSLWLINNLIKGHLKGHNNSIMNVVDEFLVVDEPILDNEDYTSVIHDIVYDVLESSKNLLEQESSSNPDIVVSLVQSVALDSIGLSARVMKEQFKEELIDCLYPVVDSLASTNDQTRLHAQNTAIILSNECYGGSLTNLIYENCDYLIDSLSLRLTSDFITPRTAAVLLVLIKVGGMELIGQLNDIVHSMFTLLDLYHGYDTLSEGFFIVFNSIIDEVYNSYLKNYDFKKETENVENYDKPWGMSNLDEVFQIIDSKNRDLEINLEGQEIPLVKHPNKPFGELPDSDDEDDVEEEDDDEMALMKEIDNYQVQKTKEEKQKWDSEIPSELYFIIQQMMSYGDRLVLSTDSIGLQSRILEVFAKVFPILSTSQTNLFPILADLWPLVLNLCVDDDIRVVSNAIKVAYTMIDFGGDFMSKKFGELWTSLKDNSKVFNDGFNLLRIVSDSNLLTKKMERLDDTINFKVYRSINEMMVLGIRKLGSTISNKMVKDIIDHTLLIVPDIELYGVYSDIAWLVRYEKFQDISKALPGTVKLQDGVIFGFYEL